MFMLIKADENDCEVNKSFSFSSVSQFASQEHWSGKLEICIDSISSLILVIAKKKLGFANGNNWNLKKVSNWEWINQWMKIRVCPFFRILASAWLWFKSVWHSQSISQSECQAEDDCSNETLLMHRHKPKQKQVLIFYINARYLCGGNNNNNNYNNDNDNDNNNNNHEGGNNKFSGIVENGLHWALKYLQLSLFFEPFFAVICMRT